MALDIMPYLIAGVQIAAGMRTGTKRGIPVLPLRRPTPIKHPRGPPPLPQIPVTQPPQQLPQSGGRIPSDDMMQGQPRNPAVLLRGLVAVLALKLDAAGVFEGISCYKSTCYLIHGSMLLYTLWRAFTRTSPAEEAPPGGDGAPPPHGRHFPPPPPQVELPISIMHSVLYRFPYVIAVISNFDLSNRP